MNVRTCLIPAAGEGVRARPQTTEVPKGMLRVAGKPILQNTIELVRDQLGISNFVIVTGYLGHLIQDYFKEGHWLNVEICYVENNDIDKGLTWSIYLARQFMDAYFMVVLGDEFYRKSNHHDLNKLSFSDSLATCGVMKTEDHDKIRQNYLVSCVDDHIVGLIEKPAIVKGNLMGTGTFVLPDKIFSYIGERYQRSNFDVDFIKLLDELCRKGERINVFELKGDYVNINDFDGLRRANQL